MSLIGGGSVCGADSVVVGISTAMVAGISTVGALEREGVTSTWTMPPSMWPSSMGGGFLVRLPILAGFDRLRPSRPTVFFNCGISAVDSISDRTAATVLSSAFVIAATDRLDLLGFELQNLFNEVAPLVGLQMPAV